MSKKRIAVLMSTYNGELYLKEQIDSIIGQKGDFLVDLIIRDDGSSDNTISILKSYAKKGCLKWYSGDNLKSAKSFIQLIIDNPEYDYYAFSDQDDVWLEHKLQNGIDAIKKIIGPCISVSDVQVVDKNLNPVESHKYIFPQTDPATILCCGGFQGCTMVFNNDLARQIYKYDVPFSISNHDSYIARVCTAIGGMIVINETKTMYYRQHSCNVIGSKMTKYEKLKDKIAQIFTPSECGISEQAELIIKRYGDCMQEDVYDFYNLARNYKSSFNNRIKLSISRKYVIKNIAWDITVRLGILLGNR